MPSYYNCIELTNYSEESFNKGYAVLSILYASIGYQNYPNGFLIDQVTAMNWPV